MVSPRRRRILIGAALLSFSACARSPAIPAAPRNASPSVRYVGSAACLGCHRDVGATFAATGMGRAFYPLDATTAVEDFTKGNRFDLKADGLAYEMSSAGGAYAMRQSVLDEDGSTLASAEEKILFVVGSGNHSRSYLAGSNGYLYQMPICWYPEKPGWDLCPGYELRNRFFTREADASCLFCHNARMPLVAGTTNRYDTGAIPHGIDCERCHGPGELHVARWKSPPPTPPETDDTIVNPLKLEKETRLHVCLQCHLGDADASERVQRAGVDLSDFRPGEPLTDFVDTMTYDPPMEDRFSLGGQGDRLLLSRCFRESGGAIDCLTCHDPHVSVYAKDRAAGGYRKACLTCHASRPCSMAEADRRRSSPADDCVSCHMRRNEPADQRFTIFTDHWIRRRPSPPAPPKETHRASLDLVPIFGTAHDAYGGAEPGINLARAYIVKRTSSLEGAAIAWSRPESLLRAAVARFPGSAEGWFLLGKTALGRGDTAEAIGDLREALARDPRHHHARANLADLLLSMGRAPEAEPLLRESVAEAPSDPSGPSDLSRALVLTGREDEARGILESAIVEHPDNPTLLANLGFLHARAGRHEEAATLLRRAGALDPSIAGIWKGIASSLLALDRPGEAAGPARRALRLAPGDTEAKLLLDRALAGRPRVAPRAGQRVDSKS
jgi:Flp pilus assembly protein TadD